MLLMKNWLETRWRLTAIFVYLTLFFVIAHRNQQPNASISSTLVMPFMILTFGVLSLPGSGLKTQSPAGFPQGLAESTQFTLALPISRLRLMAVRTAVGIAETTCVTVFAACMAWTLFPIVRAAVAPADFVRALLTTLVWLSGPYCAALLFETLLAEPFSMVIGGWTFGLLLWLLHRIAPAVDIVRAFSQASPLITHRLPWPQIITAATVSIALFLGAVRVVQTREY